MDYTGFRQVHILSSFLLEVKYAYLHSLVGEILAPSIILKLYIAGIMKSTRKYNVSNFKRLGGIFSTMIVKYLLLLTLIFSAYACSDSEDEESEGDVEGNAFVPTLFQISNTEYNPTTKTVSFLLSKKSGEDVSEAAWEKFGDAKLYTPIHKNPSGTQNMEGNVSVNADPSNDVDGFVSYMVEIEYGEDSEGTYSITIKYDTDTSASKDILTITDTMVDMAPKADITATGSETSSALEAPSIIEINQKDVFYIRSAKGTIKDDFSMDKGMDEQKEYGADGNLADSDSSMIGFCLRGTDTGCSNPDVAIPNTPGNALLGVFTSSTQTMPDTADPLNYSSDEDLFDPDRQILTDDHKKPSTGKIFYIGDGKDGNNSIYLFEVCGSCTKLNLGLTDNWFDNNGGDGLDITLSFVEYL